LIKTTDTTKDEFLVAATPIERVEKLEKWWGSDREKKIKLSKPFIIKRKQGIAPSRLQLHVDTANSFEIVLSNANKEQLIIGYDHLSKQYFIDRTKAGLSDFHPDFAAKHTAPRFASSKALDMDIILDKASIELFADAGLSVMTELYFSTKPYNRLEIRSITGTVVSKLAFHPLKSAW
jgi:fructan beta-fructosidase